MPFVKAPFYHCAAGQLGESPFCRFRSRFSINQSGPGKLDQAHSTSPVRTEKTADARPANTGQDIRKEVRIPNRRNVFRRPEHRETTRRPFIPKLTDEGSPKSLDFRFQQDYIKLEHQSGSIYFTVRRFSSCRPE